MTSSARTMTVTTPCTLWREVPIPMYWNWGLRRIFLRFLLARPSSINSHSTISSPSSPPKSYNSLNFPLTTAYSLDLYKRLTWVDDPYVVVKPYSPNLLACSSAIICRPKDHFNFLVFLSLPRRSLISSAKAKTPSLVFTFSLNTFSL